MEITGFSTSVDEDGTALCFHRWDKMRLYTATDTVDHNGPIFGRKWDGTGLSVDICGKDSGSILSQGRETGILFEVCIVRKIEHNGGYLHNVSTVLDRTVRYSNIQHCTVY